MARNESERSLVDLFKYYITFVIVIVTIFIISYTYLGYSLSHTIEESTASILEKRLYFIYIKAIGMALILFVSSIVVYSVWVAEKIRKPLKEIDEALGKVIEGNYESKLELNYSKEFVVVSNTINFLIDKLKASNEENKKLEESKTRMLMDLSHDIKTPLTTIKGFSAALNEGLVKDQEQIERYNKTIYRKSQRVSELVDDLFELVKMDSVEYRLKLSNVDICEFLRQIVLDYVDELGEREFELIVNIPEYLVELEIDSILFKRAITNLIENSIKYNPDRTTLRVELIDSKDFIVIEIADNGIGIPSIVRNNIFDAFVRGDESRSSDGGSGLGLAIAKKIVKNHGGQIELLNTEGEEKTIFSIKLPKN